MDASLRVRLHEATITKTPKRATSVYIENECFCNSKASLSWRGQLRRTRNEARCRGCTPRPFTTISGEIPYADTIHQYQCGDTLRWYHSPILVGRYIIPIPFNTNSGEIHNDYTIHHYQWRDTSRHHSPLLVGRCITPILFITISGEIHHSYTIHH